jgi:hypothetical protein
LTLERYPPLAVLFKSPEAVAVELDVLHRGKVLGPFLPSRYSPDALNGGSHLGGGCLFEGRELGAPDCSWLEDTIRKVAIGEADTEVGPITSKARHGCEDAGASGRVLLWLQVLAAPAGGEFVLRPEAWRAGKPTGAGQREAPVLGGISDEVGCLG